MYIYIYIYTYLSLSIYISIYIYIYIYIYLSLYIYIYIYIYTSYTAASPPGRPRWSPAAGTSGCPAGCGPCTSPGLFNHHNNTNQINNNCT